MIVQEVRLENVKSYGSPAEVIRFSRGVNAICGHNGAGKSTVLEAIGFVLFQHLPYRQQDFVREGEASGTITVVVESRRDQRTYEVVRRIGKGSTQYVHDPDIGQKVAQGEADVRDWLHQHLRLDDEVDLRALFLDAVGPPQGTLTATFLESGQDRKSKFDRLLRVDEYQLAFQKLVALDKALDDEIHGIDIAMASLQSRVADRAQLESERAEVRDRQYALVTQLRRSIAEHVTLDREIEAFEIAERRWRDVQNSLGLAQERERSTVAELSRARAEYQQAADARDTRERTRDGHDRYRAAIERLRQLEADQAKRDQLLQGKHRAELAVEKLQGDLTRLAEAISRVEAAAHEIAELRKKIPDQEAAEKRLEAARGAKAEAEQLGKRATSLENQLTRARNDARRAERAVAEALAHHAIADELPARRANHEKLQNALGAANRAEGQLQTLRNTIQQNRQQVTALRRQLNGLDPRIEEIVAVEAQAATLADREANYRQIAAAQAAAAAHLRHARDTRGQVAGGLCPFLHEECRNLRPGVTLETHFDAEIERWIAEAKRLDGEAKAREKALQQASAAAARVATLPQLREQREQAALALEDNQNQLANAEKQLQAVSQLASRRTEVERAALAAGQLVKEAEGAAREISRLAELREGLNAAEDNCRSLESELTATRDRLDEVHPITMDLTAAVAALNALGSPRETAARLEVEAAKAGPLRDQQARKAAEHERAIRGVAEIDRQLAPYQDLDQRLTDLRQERDSCEADYRDFVEASVPAQALDERSRALADAEDKAAQAQAKIAEARRAVEDAGRAYDGPAHARAQERRAELDKAVGDAQARIDEAEREEQRIDAEIEKIHRIELELAAQRRQKDQIEEERQTAAALRQAIRAAGPEITRQLLARISRMASQINAEVLNESGIELDWTNTYEIVTRRHGETRGFAQLSGGEQMAAALAVRLAILRDLSNVRIAFLDEPTAHLDQERRSNLGDQVQRLKGFDQLVVISHDDTFDGLFGHVIRIGRENGRSRVLDQN